MQKNESTIGSVYLQVTGRKRNGERSDHRQRAFSRIEERPTGESGTRP
jgi:hypothetical protein